MPHELSPEDLSAYLDGALEPAARAAAEAHLAACAGCRRELEALKGACAQFRRLGPRRAPPALRAAVAAARPGAAPRRAPLLYLTAGFALVVVLSVLGRAFRPQLSSAFNQIMGMVSGAAQGVASPR